MVYYFQQPFGVSGNRVDIPVTSQSDGSISYNEGYGPDYSAPRDSDPAALTIERDKMNQLFYAITSGIQQYQQHGAPDFITASDNGGIAFQYAKWSRVRYDNGTSIEIYTSKIDANATLPTNTSNWTLQRSDGAYLGVAQTFTAIQTFASAGTPVVLNSTDSTGLKIAFKDNGTNRGGIGATSVWAAAHYLPDLTTIAGGWDASGNLLPGANATYDVGSTGSAWRNMISNRFTVVGSTAPTNGMYLSAANTPTIAANSALVASFTATASVLSKITFNAPTTSAAVVFGTDNATITFQGTDTYMGRSTIDNVANKHFIANNNAFVDGTDTTKQLSFSLAGATTNFNTVIAVVSTAARTITLPNSTTTLIGTADAATLTNKIFNAIASTTGTASFNIAPGVAPTSPVNGDFWTTSEGLFGRASGVTQSLIITPWTSYTPIITNNTGSMTNATAAGKFRRVGDTLEGQGVVTVSGSTGTWNRLQISIPAGLVIDTAKLPGVAGQAIALGVGSILDSGLTIFNCLTMYIATGRVELAAFSVAVPTFSQLSFPSDTSPMVPATGDEYHFQFSVPIVGW